MKKKKKKSKIQQLADDTLQQEIGSNVIDYKFQHYQFQLELDRNDNIDELRKHMQDMHL
jgi:hypothetical protein